MNLYRLITAVNVREYDTHFSFNIEDSGSISLHASKAYLAEKGIDSISEGEEFFIKGRGRRGNEDAMLASPNCLEDIRKA